jgi:hypothetical protein
MSGKAKMTKAKVIVGLLIAVTGCSSGGGSAMGGAGARGAGGSAGGGGGGGQSCAPAAVVGVTNEGTVSWLDNGKLSCAFLIIADRTTGTAADTIEVDATTPDSRGIDFVLSSYNGLLGGSYTCQPGNGTSQPYVALEIIGQKASGNVAMSACTVSIAFTMDSAGQQRAQGTFSGTLTGDAGTESVTGGTFDITVSLTGG